jgi:WD40 repeat protein/serine/threonine protein kinase
MTPLTPDFGTPPKPPFAPLQPPPPRVPDHELFRIIGRGAYGEVWIGRNLMGTWRAIKVVRRTEFENDRPLQREFRGIRAFEPVSRTHPGLTDILQLGANEAEGYIYYVMELADDEATGQEINPDTYRPRTLRSDMTRRGRLPFAECLPIAVSLADALRHLHAHKLVHRDIKPSNIIFVNGIAKLADIGLVAESGGPNTFVGTEGFIPPEGPGSAGADLYGLGKTLYEISTGLDRLKFPEPPPDLLKDPERDDLLELNAVILKACATGKNRYASAEDMHQDLVLLQGGKSVRRLRAAERRWKVAKRGATVLLPLLLLGAVTFWWQRDQADKFKKLATDERTQRLLANQLLDRLDIDKANSFFEQDRSSEAFAHLVRVLRRSPSNYVASVMTLNWLDQVGMPTEVCPPLRHEKGVMSAAFGPDGRWVVTASADNTARVWEAQSGQPVSPPLPHTDVVASAVFNSDGRWVVTASADNTARVWEAQSGQPVSPLLQHLGSIDFAEFSPDGRWVVTASWDGTARVWDAQTGKTVSPLLRHKSGVSHAEFSPDGRRVVTASADNTARVWEVQSGQPASQPLKHDGSVQFAAFSPDGCWVVTASDDRSARVWEVQSGQPVSPPLRHQGAVQSAAFSPDGRWVVTASSDKTARVWEARSGRPVGAPLWHKGVVPSVAFSPDGRWVATASHDGTARVWEAQGRKPLSPALRAENSVVCASFNSDGRLVVTASRDGTARVWEVQTGQPVSPPLRHTNSVNSAAFSPDGRWVVTASADETARVWEAQTGQPVSPPLRHTNSVISAVFSSDGRWVVTASADFTAQVWEARTAQPVSSPLRHEDSVASAGFSPDGRWVVTASADFTARVWEVHTGQPVSPPLRHENRVLSASFSPDGRWVVTASADFTARVWEAESGQPLSPPLRHRNVVASAAFSPNGHCVVTASGDRTARVWEAKTGQPASPPMWHEMAVQSAGFSPDGRWVVTASDDKTARVWDAQSGQSVSPPLRHDDRINSAEFSPDGRWIVTASDDKTARMWCPHTYLSSTATWLADLAEMVAGLATSDLGDFYLAPVQNWSLRSQLATNAATDDLSIWARWFVADLHRRPVNAWSKVFLTEYVDSCLSQATLSGANCAADLAPTNGLVYAGLALATLSSVGKDSSGLARAEFLSRRAVRLAPDSAEVWHVRARVLCAANDPTNAFSAIECAVQLAAAEMPSWKPLTWQTIAECAERAGRLTDGIALLDRVGQRGSLEPQLRQLSALLRGLLYEKESKFTEACKAFGEGLAVLPSVRETHLKLLLKRSDVFRRLGQTAESNADYMEFMEAELPSAMECNIAAWQSVAGPIEQRDSERALLLVQRALRLESGNPLYLNTLGVAYYRTGQYAKALETLLEASRLNALSQDSNSYAPDIDFWFVSMAYHQLGNTVKAKEFYDKAVAEWNKRMAQPGAQEDPELKPFRAEAEKLLGIPKRE